MADILIANGVAIDKSQVNSGLSTTMNADEATARGTAWQAALLSTRFRVKEFQVARSDPPSRRHTRAHRDTR